MSSSTKKTVPIGVGITDTFYRYQMEAVDCGYKRRQNKTAILNMVKIAKDINRSPEEVIKYLGHSLSSSGSYSSKSQEYVLNGNYSQSDIQHRLQEYCEAFVVCGLCCNPETQYKIKRASIFLRCAACGGKSQVDETHKLCKFILMRHNSSLQKQSREVRSSRVKKKNQIEFVDKSKESNGKVLNDDAKIKSKKRSAQVNASIPKESDYDEEFVNPYFSTKDNPLYVGRFDRIAKASTRDEGDALEYAVRKVRAFLSSHPDAPTSDVVNTVISVQESVKVLFSQDRLQILVRAGSEEEGVLHCLSEYADALVRLMEFDQSMEHYLIAVLEQVCSNNHKMFPMALMKLYESDVLQEEALLQWSAQRLSVDGLVNEEVHSALLSAAEPLMAWLREENTVEG